MACTTRIKAMPMSVDNNFKTWIVSSTASLTPIRSASNKVKLDSSPKANVFHSSCELESYFHSWHPSLSDKH